MGFEGRRPLRPFRLSVLTTAEKWAVVRKGGRDPGKGFSAQAVHTSAEKHPASKDLDPPRPKGPYRDQGPPPRSKAGGPDVRRK